MNCRNHQARQPEPMEDDPTVAATLEVDSTDTGSFHNLDPEFHLEARRCHHVQDIVPEHQQRFVNKMKAFKTRWNKAFPDKACVECGTLLLPRNRVKKPRDPTHIYGMTAVFGCPIRTPVVILCKPCFKNPGCPVDCGRIPQCICNLHPRSQHFLSPFKLDTNLGRTQGYNVDAIPFTYRTLSGLMNLNPQNKRSVALYLGALGAFLESHRGNQWDQGHDQAGLLWCRDWLLAHNAIFQCHDVQRHIQVPQPLPVVHLADEDSEIGLTWL